MKKKLSAIITMVVLFVYAQPLFAEPITGESYLIDFVVLNKNKTSEDRKAYDRLLDPIIKKHGAKKVQSYDLNYFITGQLKGASTLNIYRMKSADTLAAVVGDPAYKKLDGLRKSTFDMSKVTLYIGEPLKNIGQLHSDLILVDLVVMNEGYGHPDSFKYEEKIAKIASKYGATISNTFDIDKKLTGIGPDKALKLNIWSLPSSETMQKVTNDPEYKKLAAYRNKIHDMSAVTLYMANPAASCAKCNLK